MIRIVDASAIGAVLLVERDAAWVTQHTDGMDLLAPALLPFEVGNICWKRLQRVPAERDRILAIWAAWCASQSVRLVAPDPVQTLQLAHDTGLTFYDASYLSVAQSNKAELISLDTRLVQAARSLGLRAPTPQMAPRSRN
jgi:predicted nucleic acid-binding protein